MKALTQAIYSKFTGSALDTLLGGRLYKLEAPDATPFPYAVYFPVSDLPEYPGGHTIEHLLFQFSLFSSASSSGEIEDLLTSLRALYDDCTLAITGETLIYCIRGNLMTSRDDVETPLGTVGIWHYSQEYDLQTVV